MDEETIKRLLGDFPQHPGMPLFALPPQQQWAVKEYAEFEQLAGQIRYSYRLNTAYSIHEVLEACKEVCTHYPSRGLDTMAILANGQNKTVIRDFIKELAAIQKEG